ncbi:MAG TPA: hypothetical protein VFQ34_04720 [Nitrospiraceae bacterium]|nr:hypothetical protein [Nitrospiraceae bacterium]
MNTSELTNTGPRQGDRFVRRLALFACLMILAADFLPGLVPAQAFADMQRAQVVRFLGVSLARDWRDIRHGAVGEIIVGWEERADHHGIVVSFVQGKGSFSSDTELAILVAVDRAARTAGLRTDSWTVTFAVHEPAGVIYGDSISGLVGLTVVALAKGDFIPIDRTMTGTISQDGTIGPVSALPLKIEAAFQKHLRRVVVPEMLDATDDDWETPFMMQVSPIRSAAVAYQALTDHPLLDALR